MSNHVLILDCGCEVAPGQGGTLNHFLSDTAAATLQDLGYAVRITRLDQGYEIAAEKKSILWADHVLVQFPAWWMSAPWKLKKYIDEVFGGPDFLTGDGRHRDHPELKYGTGGLLRDKHYMLSSTWNAPAEAFTDPAQFFEGRGIDGVCLPLHKAFQFIGMQPLPSFIMNDVIKNPAIEADTARFIAHLRATFKAQ